MNVLPIPLVREPRERVAEQGIGGAAHETQMPPALARPVRDQSFEAWIDRGPPTGRPDDRGRQADQLKHPDRRVGGIVSNLIRRSPRGGCVRLHSDQNPFALGSGWFIGKPRPQAVATVGAAAGMGGLAETAALVGRFDQKAVKGAQNEREKRELSG